MAAASISGVQVSPHRDFSADLAAEHAKRAAAEERARRKQEIERIMRKYDTDNSGSLGQDELKLLLADFSISVSGTQVTPSQDDVDFLLAMSDDHVESHSDVIETRHVFLVCESWAAFLMQRDVVRLLLEKHDKDASLKIGQDELQEILDELNKGAAVPEEVTKWVMKQGDLVGDGEMGEMELSRALCAFEKWREKQHRFQKPGNHEPLPKRQPPEDIYAPPPSACCVIA
mmetsp:Transcript_51160/g.119909  ORF Transcript_51160/g.119909 Transcript_51160/m.119909 type:complete len:230 (+) Transcript_51160:125-814(+)